MELSDVMRTTPATRDFADAPVPDDLIHAVLDDARFAPNGGNRQAWRVVVVREPATKLRLAELYELGRREPDAHQRHGLIPFVASEAAWRFPWGHPPTPAIDLDLARATPAEPVTPPERHFIGQASVLLVVLLDLTRAMAMDAGLDRIPVSVGASVYPFVQNILLAARARGLGGVPTTVLARQEPAVRALLAIPTRFALASVVPLGRPTRTVTALSRVPVETFAFLDSFDGEPLRGAATAAGSS